MTSSVSVIPRRRLMAGGVSALGLAALGGGALGGLAGCGGPAPSGTGGGEASGTIRLLTPIFEGDDGAKLLTDLLATFKKKYPEVTVQPDHTTYSNLNEKITTSLASGRPYDVMLIGVGWIPPFANKGVLAAFDTTADKLAKTYNRRVIDGGVWQGKVYALPIMLDTRFGIYRKDIFAEAGITAPPKSFAELRQMAKQLTTRSGGKLTRAGIDILSLDLRQCFLPFLWANGGDLFTADGKPAFNSDAGVGALQTMTDIIRTDRSEDYGFTKAGDVAIPLVQGRAAMMIGHNNVWQNVQQNASDLISGGRLGTFVLTNVRPAMFQGGTLASVSAASQHLEAAKALAQYLAGPDVCLAASQQRGNVPAATSLLSSDYVKGDAFVQFAMQNMDYAYSEGGVPAWLTIRSDFKAAIESALLGKATPGKALNDLAARANDAIARSS